MGPAEIDACISGDECRMGVKGGTSKKVTPRIAKGGLKGVVEDMEVLIIAVKHRCAFTIASDHYLAA